MTFADDVKQAIEALDQLETVYRNNEEHIDYCDNKQQDLLHEIEFNNFSASQGFVLAKELRNVRLLRRQYKDENKRMKPVMKLLDAHKGLIEQLSKARETMKNIDTNMSARGYRERATTTMQVALEEARQEV